MEWIGFAILILLYILVLRIIDCLECLRQISGRVDHCRLEIEDLKRLVGSKLTRIEERQERGNHGR